MNKSPVFPSGVPKKAIIEDVSFIFDTTPDSNGKYTLNVLNGTPGFYDLYYTFIPKIAHFFGLLTFLFELQLYTHRYTFNTFNVYLISTQCVHNRHQIVRGLEKRMAKPIELGLRLEHEKDVLQFEEYLRNPTYTKRGRKLIEEAADLAKNMKW